MEHLQGMQIKPDFCVDTDQNISSSTVVGVIAKRIRTVKTLQLSSHLSTMVAVFAIQPVAVILLLLNMLRHLIRNRAEFEREMAVFHVDILPYMYHLVKGSWVIKGPDKRWTRFYHYSVVILFSYLPLCMLWHSQHLTADD